MNFGFIKLPHDFDLFEKYNIFLLHLIREANYMDGECKGKVIKRGQLLTGRKQLALETNQKIGQVRWALDALEEAGKITKVTTKTDTLITIPPHIYNRFSGKNNNQDKTDVTNLESTSYEPNNETNNQQEAPTTKVTTKVTKNYNQGNNQGNNQQNNDLNPSLSITSEQDISTNNQGYNQGNNQQNQKLQPSLQPLLKNNKEEEKNINTIPSGIEKDFFKNFSKTAKEETWPEEAEKFMKADGFIRELRRKYPEWDKNKMLTTMKKWLIELNDQEDQKKLPGLIEHFRRKVAKVKRENTDAEFLSKLDEIGVKKFYRGEGRKPKIQRKCANELPDGYEKMLEEMGSGLIEFGRD